MKDTIIINIITCGLAFGAVIFAYWLGRRHGRREILDKVQGWIRDKEDQR